MIKFLTILLLFLSVSLFTQVNIELQKTFKDHNTETCFARFYSEDKVISADKDGGIFVWSIKENEKDKLNAHKSQVVEIFELPNGNWCSYDKSGQIVWWDDQNWNKIDEFQISDKIIGEGVHVEFISFKEKDLLIGLNDGRFYWLKNKELTLELDLHKKINHGMLSDDNRFLLFAEGNTVVFWDLQRSHVVRTISTTGGEGVDYFEFSPNHKELAIWTSNGTIEIVDTNQGMLVNTPKAGLSNTGQFCFSPDGLYIVSGNSLDAFKFWNTTDLSELFEVNQHKSTVNFCEFNQDGSMLLTASDDGTVKLWNTSFAENENDENLADFEFEYEGKTLVSVDGRKNKNVQSFTFKQPYLSFKIKDNRYVDGDVCTLLLNEGIILEDYELTGEEKELKYKLEKGKTYTLTLYAVDMGKNPPNNAEIELSDEISSHKFQLSSSLKSCQSVLIRIE